MSILNGDNVIYTEKTGLKKTSQAFSTESDRLVTMKQNLNDKSNEALENWIGTAGISFAKAVETVDMEMETADSKILGVSVTLNTVADNRQLIDDAAKAGAFGKPNFTGKD